MYRYLSAFSHGSDPSAHFFVPDGTDVPVLKLLPGTDELGRVLPMACRVLLEMAGGVSKRLGLGIEDDVETFKKKALASAEKWAD